MNDLKFSTTNSDIAKLLEISGTLFDISAATSVLGWDQETYMPPKGVIHRGRQLATLSAVYHEKLTNPKVGQLLEKLESTKVSEFERFSLADRALIRETRREYDRAVKIPERLVREMAQVCSTGLETWKEARLKKDFSIFASSLQKIVALKKEEAGLLGFAKSPYDALLDEYEPGMTGEEIDRIFNPLRKEIVLLLNKIVESGKPVSEHFLKGKKYNFNKSRKITEKILEKIGYDFESGRQDVSTHPFTTNFGYADVRVTNRFAGNDLGSSIFSAIHEGGHALYELGIDEKIGDTTLAGGTSLGIHESQSRMWENFIGRSKEFWEYWTPYLKSQFKLQLQNVTPEKVYREINEVRPDFIRVEADEVTYNLHIILRFEIERDLIAGKVEVKDLPEVWNSKFKEMFGLVVPDDSQGVLQDIHWSQGSIGYFPTYTLGNLYSAQIYNTLSREIGGIGEHVSSGNFEPILHWLREKIHRFGGIYEPKELIKNVTGEALNPKYFVNYLNQKYSHLYDLT